MGMMDIMKIKNAVARKLNLAVDFVTSLAAGMEALLEPEMARGWIGDCRQPGCRPEIIILPNTNSAILSTNYYGNKPLNHYCHV